MTWARTGFNPQTRARYLDDDRRARMGDFAQAWADAEQPRFGKGVMLEAEFEFVFPRPASHFGTGRNSGLLKPRFADARPGSGQYGGDLDNLVKLVKDALESFAYANDSQLAVYRAEKRFVAGDEFPHTRVRIRPL